MRKVVALHTSILILPYFQLWINYFKNFLNIYIYIYVVLFLGCPKMHFQDFQKTHFFTYFLQSCHFALKVSDKYLRSSWGSDIPLELILYPCSWKSSGALFNRFYGFILFLNSCIFQIQFEEHLRMKYSFRILGLSWKNL